MRTATDQTFVSADGTQLFYRRWAPSSSATRRALIVFHRGHEHSGRMQAVVDGLDLPEFDIFAWDARGHGRSPGERGYAEDIGVLVKDVDSFVRHVCETHRYAQGDVAIVAQSVGAVLVATWLHDFAPKVRCAVLASPAFEVKLYVPFAIPGLRLLLKLKGKAFVNSYVKAKFLTHDPERISSYQADPLITRAIAVNILIGLFDVAERVIADAAAIVTPTQVLISGADWVVHQKPQKRFFERLGAAVKELHEFAGFYHDTLGEKDRHLPLARAREFILRQFESAVSVPSLLAADEAGHTKDEYDRLAAPASVPSALYYGATRMGFATLGRLSDGIALGLRTGFDSGSTLDYVYRNVPSGKTPLGRLFDAAYLNSIGWKGIRIRKQHIESLLARVFAMLLSSGQPVRLVDIAAGHGRYVVEALEGLKGRDFGALLRDYSALNVESGRTLIASRGLSERVSFESGDAFDPQSLAAIPRDRTVAVISGLYELFPDNARIRRSLTGVAQALVQGAYLVYTNQPWHPQLELIARTLSSHRGGQPWVMRRRVQAEMDQLVEEAGFSKLDQLVDQWGIFSVSLARKTA